MNFWGVGPVPVRAGLHWAWTDPDTKGSNSGLDGSRPRADRFTSGSDPAQGKPFRAGTLPSPSRSSSGLDGVQVRCGPPRPWTDPGVWQTVSVLVLSRASADCSVLGSVQTPRLKLTSSWFKGLAASFVPVVGNLNEILPNINQSPAKNTAINQSPRYDRPRINQ